MEPLNVYLAAEVGALKEKLAKVTKEAEIQKTLVQMERRRVLVLQENQRAEAVTMRLLWGAIEGYNEKIDMLIEYAAFMEEKSMYRPAVSRERFRAGNDGPSHGKIKEVVDWVCEILSLEEDNIGPNE